MSTDRKPSAFTRLGRLLVNLVLVGVTLVATAYLAPSLLGYDRYVITGGSMSGTFEKGSVAVAEQVPVEDLRVGDVITYLPPPDSGVTTLVTHRITAIRGQQDGGRVFRTQGDANPDPDPWRFSLDEGTQARVALTVPQVGYAVIALADPDTRMLVIGVPAGLIALISLAEAAVAMRPRRPQPSDQPTTEPAPAAHPTAPATASVPGPRVATSVPTPRPALR